MACVTAGHAMSVRRCIVVEDVLLCARYSVWRTRLRSTISVLPLLVKIARAGLRIARVVIYPSSLAHMPDQITFIPRLRHH
jgi:hypothetical protein